MKLTIGDELQNLFHPTVNATKQAAEETRREPAPIKKTLMDIDGALTADTTYGLYQKQDRQLGMGNKIVRLDGKTLLVDDPEYKLVF